MVSNLVSFFSLEVTHRFLGATARAGLSSNYADNQRCGQPATLSQSTRAAEIVFLCDPPVVARWVSFDIDPSYPGVTEAALQLAEVSVKEYTWECNQTPGERALKLFFAFHKSFYDECQQLLTSTGSERRTISVIKTS